MKSYYDFNIDYSLKQTRIIAHQLGFTYYKPDLPFITGPVEAELRPKENLKTINWSAGLKWDF